VNGGSVTLTITRNGSLSGASRVTVSTSDGTAANGVRYTPVQLTVNFADGETSKTVDVPLINDSAIEGAQTFTATLSSPVGATLGASTNATITVLDDDTIKNDFSPQPDGKADILWRNETTGDTRVWLMDGTSIRSSVLLQRQGSPLVLVGSGDFDGDGHADLLWRNANDHTLTIWYMNGTTFGSSAPMPGSTDPNWEPVAVGDLNGDGYADIVWRHSTQGATNVWLMQNTRFLQAVALPTVPDLNWKVIGIGDFNRDKKNDLVWRNSATRDVAVWVMNGTTFTTAAFLPKVGDPWKLVGIADMNGDGDADMIWQTTTTRQIALWQMNQTAFGRAYFIDTTADSSTANDPQWAIAGPR
jgi:hypothetical protein